MGISRADDYWVSYSYLDYCRTSVNCNFEEFTRCNEWNSVTVVGNFGIKARLRSENGNVESALVLIPLLFLFLIAVELIVATNLRNSDFALAQGDASTRAISQELRSTDQVIDLNSSDPFLHMKLLISKRQHSLPQLVPGLFALLGGNSAVEVHGVAVMENLN